MLRQIGRADTILIGEWIGQNCHNETFIAGTSVGGLLFVVRRLDSAGQSDRTGVQLLSGSAAGPSVLTGECLLAFREMLVFPCQTEKHITVPTASHTHARTHTHRHAHTRADSTCTHTYAQARKRARTHTHARAHTHAHIRTHAYTYSHTHARASTHTHTHTPLYRQHCSTPWHTTVQFS